MSVYKIFKMNALPEQLESNSIYLIAHNSRQDLFEIYVTASTSNNVRRLLTEADVQTMITTALQRQNFNTIRIVQNIAERNALNLNSDTLVFVYNATADPSVSQGSALYVYVKSDNNFIKVAEYESLDFVIDYQSIQNKPNSSASDIDDAVNKKHSHNNISVLNNLSVNNDVLMFNNNYLKIGWDLVEW